MLTLDVPYVPDQEPPIVLAQAATPGAGSPTPRPDYVLTACQEAESTRDSAAGFNGVSPAAILKYSLERHDKTRTLVVGPAAVKITLLQGTTHGKILEVGDGGKAYYYDPIPSYVGKDSAVFMAEFAGKRYKIVLNLVVSTTVSENPLTSDMAPPCPKPKLIKVNPTASSNAPTASAMQGLTWRSTSLPSVAGRCAIKPRSAG